MKLREHVWVFDKCIVCGAFAWATVRSKAVLEGKTDPGTTDERTCLERDDYQTRLCPAPARRQFAYEDFDTIKRRIDEIEAQRIAAINTATT